MASSNRKMSKTAAAAVIKRLKPKYREYVRFQTAKKNAKKPAEVKAAQKGMDGLRKEYTEYRNAYRVMIANGGITGKANGGSKPKATAKKSTAKKSTTKAKAAPRKRTATAPKPAPEATPETTTTAAPTTGVSTEA